MLNHDLRAATRGLLFSLAIVAPATALGYEAKPADAQAEAPPTRQYTFAWRFADGDKLAPRGGTSRGTPIELATGPDARWTALQEAGISDFERDRRAILAMAGEYRASFDFIEVADLAPPYEVTRPYQSWGTEKVYVLEDRGDFISLQHVLVMKVIGKDGEVKGPIVTKHWRQDWQYEPSDSFAYVGRNTWQSMPVPEAESNGAWLQTVYQVDDSPRYAGVARWQHQPNYSTWLSGEDWRPLPRREFSVRSDYHVLAGMNRHTITPFGWLHEQQNNKLALPAVGAGDAEPVVVGREYGLNRYERIEGFDFSPGDEYLARTAALWAAVRDEWQAILASRQPVVLKGAPDKDQLFKPLFSLADSLEESAPSPEDLAREARALVRQYLAGEAGDGTVVARLGRE